jgi:uncharacterized protein (TIGR02145 family)
MTKLFILIILGIMVKTVSAQSSDSAKFLCGVSTVQYAGQIYHTVQIGNQCWLKENLNVGTMIPGIQDQANRDRIEKYCHNDDPNTCSVYGGSYQWNEAMQYDTTEKAQGICPGGWHIPAKAEFEKLEVAVNNHGNSLKAIGQGSGDGAGTNTSGFSAVLAGNRTNGGGDSNFGYSADFWTSTVLDGDNSPLYFSGLYYNENWMQFTKTNKREAFSVRCVKD